MVRDLDWLKARTVETASGCWEWTGCRVQGYGQFSFQIPSGGRRKEYAHRWAVELTSGPIPKGMMACHRCDNPPCCNPAHLFVGTPGENLRDAIDKGRWISPRRRLSDQDIAEIRTLRTAGLTLAVIAQRFGVSSAHVCNISNNRVRVAA